MLDAEAAFAGIAGQVELMRRGDASARDLAGLALARIAALDPQLNAFGAVLADRALTAADEADRRRAAGEDGPLLGVPIAVKDEIDVAGHLTSRGTDAFTVPAASDAEVVRRLRAAGAVIVGKTTMPELGLWPFTESVTWGVTRNPWDTGRTPGGSSGGSAAAVAAGIVPAALAADGAGSIRIPAACTGLFGLKPQRGRVPRAPHDRDGSHWIVFGALTRSVLDSGIMLDALTESPGTFTAARRAPSRPRCGSPSPRRSHRACSDASPPTSATRCTAPPTSCAGSATRSSSATSTSGPATPRSSSDCCSAASATSSPRRSARAGSSVAAARSPGRARSSPTGMRERLLEAERRLAARVGTLFDEHDVLLTPVMSQPAPRAGLMEGRGATVTYLWESGWVPFNVLWNSTGQPAASVPAGFSGEGLPLAVQLVGRPDAEATLLSLAAQLETARPWADRRPPVS